MVTDRFHLGNIVLRKVLLAVLALALLTGAAYADTVTLKNGRKLKGKIKSHTPEEIVIEVGGAGTVTVKMDRVAGVEYEAEEVQPPPDAQPPDQSPPAPTADREGEPDAADEAAEDEDKLSPVEMLVGALVGLLINGFFLWGAISAADPGNKKNKYLAAVGWSIITIGANLLWPFYGLVLSMVVLMMILLTYYDISFLRSFLVLILLFLLELGGTFLLAALIVFISSLCG